MVSARPSLRRSSSSRSGDQEAFPTRQLFILALCRLCEPIAFMSIFPYIYYMVKSFNITDDGRQIGMYAGMVTSAFAIAEFLASIFWGRLSDRIGRKPVLITGIFGTGVSMILFGFAPSLPVALFARAMGGILNGNIGVLQTTVAEVVKHERHQARAFAIMPFVWSIGSIVGASLGGALAEPVKNYPSMFRPGSIYDKFPYLLPNLVCAAFVGFSLICGLFFLEETHEDKQGTRDACLEIGDWFLGLFSSRSRRARSISEEKLTLMHEDVKVEFDSRESAPRVSSIDIPVRIPKHVQPSKAQYKWREMFTNQVMLNILAYGLLALHTISLEQLLPILFSMPESKSTPHLPFKFVGGLNLPTKTIGFILSAQGGLQVIAQMFIFPKVQKRLGTLRTFRLVIFSYPILYWIVPYVTLLPTFLQYPAIFFILVWKVTTQAMSYPSNTMMLVNQAPSKRVLGTLNGFAASAASLARAIGPTIAGVIQAAGLNIGVSGLPWWTCAAVAVIGACVSLFQQDKKSSESSVPIDDEESLCGESLLGSEDLSHRASFESTSDTESIVSVKTMVKTSSPELINLST